MTKLATNWDALVASAPINTQAAKDAGAKGGGFEPRKKVIEDWHFHSHAPLLTRRVPKDPNIKNLTGLKVGRLTVLGLSEKRSGRAMWVVRCVCGDYEVRSTKYLTKTATPERAMCSLCDHVSEMKLGHVPAAEIKLTTRNVKP